MPTYESIGYNSPDGSQWGQTSTDLVGMYGATPVVRYVGAGAASTYVLMGQTTDAVTTYFLNSAAAVTSLVLQVSTITTALRNFGLID